MRYILSFTFLLVGCTPEKAEPCYACTSFVRYSGGSPGVAPPSPFSTEKTICDEAEKTRLEQPTSDALTTGSTPLIKNTNTVCVKRR